MPRQSPFPTLLAAGSLLLAAAAFAQGAPTPPPGGPPPGKGGGACRADIAALCPNLQPGPGEHAAIAKCLESQADKLSAPCKAHLDEEKARMEAFKAACKPDAEKFCDGIAAGGGHILQCLQQHQSELSDACKAAWPKRHGPPPGAPPGQPQQ
ncbi:MAG: cysteine rich repeat-containing protein [Myxococcaceae bacterium]